MAILQPVEPAKSEQRAPPVCLIDASIYIFRYYFSLPERWHSRDESFPTEAVYGYTGFLLDFLAFQQPNYIAACFDESLGSCFRNELYPNYKASRALPDEALAFQLQACQEITELLGISCFSSEMYEADDLLGSLMQWCHASPKLGDTPVALLTRDKDLGQLLLRDTDYLWHVTKPTVTKPSSIDADCSGRNDIHDKFGVWPEQMSDYLALVGDSVDDIPGVPSIGAKTAATLLQHFGSFEQLYSRLDELPSLPVRGAKTLAEKLSCHYEQALVSRTLATIVTDIELDVTLSTFERTTVDVPRLQDFGERMGFGPAFQKRVDQLFAHSD